MGLRYLVHQMLHFQDYHLYLGQVMKKNVIHIDVIKLHTMNTESKCSSNEDSEYPWLDFCVDVPLCNSLGGKYVDGVCVDSVNKKPIKSINEEIKNNYTTKYWQECKKVSWTNYDNMVKNEQRKYKEKDNELNNEINQKDIYIK